MIYLMIVAMGLVVFFNRYLFIEPRLPVRLNRGARRAHGGMRCRGTAELGLVELSALGVGGGGLGCVGDERGVCL